MLPDPLGCNGFGLLGASDGLFGMGGNGWVGGADGGGRGLLGLVRPLKVRLLGDTSDPLDGKADNAERLSDNAAGLFLRCLPTAFANAAS